MTASIPTLRPVGAATAIAALASAELRLLLRNRLVLGTAVVMPLLLGALVTVNNQGSDPRAWGLTAALQTMMILCLALYAGASTALTARRQDAHLKRLRGGEVSDGVLLAGLLIPTALLAIGQLVVLFALLVVFGAPLPVNVGPIVLGLLGGITMFAAAAVVTSGLTKEAATAQFTTGPWLLLTLAGALLALIIDPGTLAGLAVPGAATAHLVQSGWSGDIDPTRLLVSVAALIGWTAVLSFAALRMFRWDPRR